MSGGLRFHKVRHKALANFVDAHGLGDRAYRLLHHLVEEADWRTGVVEQFNKTACANELGWGRNRIAERLAELQEAGAVLVHDARGKTPGSVEILVFADLVDNPSGPAQRAPDRRGQTDERAPDRRGQTGQRAPDGRALHRESAGQSGLFGPVEKDLEKDVDNTPSPYPSPTGQEVVPEAKAKAQTERASVDEDRAASVLVAHIAARLAPSDRERFFTTADTGARITLARVAGELLGQGWAPADLVDELGGRELPPNPFSPAAVVLDRARRLAAQIEPLAATARSLAAQRVDEERADAVAEAERWARSLLEVHWDDDADLLDTIVGRFPDDDDLREAACRAAGWVAA